MPQVIALLDPNLILVAVALAAPAAMWAALLVGLLRPRRRRWLALDEERSDEPRRGYKAAQVRVHADRHEAQLCGITLGGCYGVDDEASCAHAGCEPPDLDCTCGFYAYKDRVAATGLLRRSATRGGGPARALLTVDLWGRVLQYERGYRAQRQHVLGVQFARTCSVCKAGDSGGLALDGDDQGWTTVSFRCQRHRGAASRHLTAATLAGLLATEVALLELPAADAA